MSRYCRCERDRIGPDWDIGPDGGVCRSCELEVAHGDVRRMCAIARAATRDHGPPRANAECSSCGAPYVRGRPEWTTCLACELGGAEVTGAG
jgi:hypothetical protein